MHQQAQPMVDLHIRRMKTLVSYAFVFCIFSVYAVYAVSLGQPELWANDIHSPRVWLYSVDDSTFKMSHFKSAVVALTQDIRTKLYLTDATSVPRGSYYNVPRGRHDRAKFVHHFHRLSILSIYGIRSPWMAYIRFASFEF